MIIIKQIIKKDIINKEIIVLCSDNKQYIFRLNRMFQSDIPIGMCNTWKLLLKNNNFNKATVIHGDLVWGTFCEILHTEIFDYMEVIK